MSATWWTEEQDAALLDGRRRGEMFRAIGESVGRSAASAMHRYRILQRGAPRHRWGNGEDARLIALLEDHVSWDDIATAMGVTKSACQVRARALGISFRTANGYDQRAICRIMGVAHQALARWVRRGLLRVHPTTQRRGRGCFRFVELDDLAEFLADEGHWHHWEPERITDLAIREWATELRQGLTFLTTTQAAPILCMSPLGVQLAIREGRLRAVRRAEKGGKWLVRSDWLHLAAPRSLKGRPKAPSYTDADIAMVQRWWGKRPGPWIAAQLGRGADSGIHMLARRIGLPKLGRGVWKRRAAG